MKLTHSFAFASGTSRGDCHWLGYRYDDPPGFSPTAGDSWIGQTDGEVSSMLMSQPGWMTCLWRTPTRVWVSEASGRIYMNPSVRLREEPWQTFRVDATISGIWGLTDDLVFAWGMNRGAPVAFRFDGSGFQPIDVPGFIVGVRGSRDDLIYAVGNRGLIARWDGRGFTAVQSPIASTLSDVFVVDEDEMYACGSDGDLLLGTMHGWERLLTFEGALHCVAKWNDTVWVGAGEDGVFKLEDEKLVSYKPKVLAERFDVRGSLLITAPNAIIDGQTFKGTLVSTFEKLSTHSPPPWRD